MNKPGAWHLRSILKRSCSRFDVEESMDHLDGFVYDLAQYRLSDVFKIPKRSGCNPICRTIRTDGNEIEYELNENITQRPEKKTASEPTIVNSNVEQSPLEVRIRLWILNFSIGCISLGYLLLFVLVNVVFAALWSIQDKKCCGDSTMSFRDVFNFAIQTTTTLGYGGYEPEGFFPNCLVVIVSFVSLTLNTLYAGILFLKFVTPSAKIVFSDIMTLCNVNGLPCLQIRVGNADGSKMILTDISARLSFMYTITYDDGCGEDVTIWNTQSLKLLSDWRHELTGVWTLRHVLDEASPLFGVMGVHPFDKNLKYFRLSINATQAVSKTHVSASMGYQPEDVLVGHKFEDQLEFDQEKGVLTIDYAKMNNTRPHLVWYPSKKCMEPNKLQQDMEPNKLQRHEKKLDQEV